MKKNRISYLCHLLEIKDLAQEAMYGAEINLSIAKKILGRSTDNLKKIKDLITEFRGEKI